MSFNIKVSEDNCCILVKVKGDIDTRVAMEFTVESHRLAKEKGIRLLLIDLSESRNIQSEHENYDFVNQDLDENPEVDRRIKAALYVSPDDHSHDFTENVARSDGYDIKLFRNLEEAKSYLRS